MKGNKNFPILYFFFPAFLLIAIVFFLFKKSEIKKHENIQLDLNSFLNIVQSPLIFKGHNNSSFVFTSSLDDLKTLGLKINEPVWHYDISHLGSVEFIKDETGVIARRAYASPEYLLAGTRNITMSSENDNSYYSLTIKSESGETLTILFFPSKESVNIGLAIAIKYSGR